MIRTILAIVILVLATLFLPFWVQAIFYLVAVLFITHRLWLLLPALFADVWYSPVRSFHLENNKTVLLVLAMLILYFIIIRNTRVTQAYGLEKK